MVINERQKGGYIVKAPQGTINMNIEVTRPKGYGVRMWIAGKLIRAAELVARQKLTFRVKQTSDE